MASPSGPGPSWISSPSLPLRLSRSSPGIAGSTPRATACHSHRPARLATIKTLLGFSRAAGVGNSIKFLVKRAADVTKLMSINAPDKQVIDLARYAAEDPKAGISGVHMYAIGGLKRTSAWSYALRDGLFEVTDKDQLKVSVDLG